MWIILGAFILALSYLGMALAVYDPKEESWNQ